MSRNRPPETDPPNAISPVPGSQESPVAVTDPIDPSSVPETNRSLRSASLSDSSASLSDSSADRAAAEKASATKPKKDTRKNDMYAAIDAAGLECAADFYGQRNRVIDPKHKPDAEFIDQNWKRVSEPFKAFAGPRLPDLKAHFISRLCTAVADLVLVKN